MEEKERYEYCPAQNQLYDNIINELYCLGIEQDKTRLVDFLNLMNKDWRTLYERNIELREENQQLKQSQKQLAISELRRIKEYILINDEYDEEAGCNIIETFDLLEEIRDLLKK